VYTAEILLKDQQHPLAIFQISFATVSCHRNLCCKMSVRHCPSGKVKLWHFYAKNIFKKNPWNTSKLNFEI